MTIDELIFSRLTAWVGLNAIIGTRVYPNRGPQGVTVPYIVWATVTSREPTTFGTNQTPRPITARFQFDIYATTYSQMKQIRLELKLALRGWITSDVAGTEIDNEIDDFDDDLDLHKGILDAFISYSE